MHISVRVGLALVGALFIVISALSGACQRRETAIREDDLCLTNLAQIYVGMRHWEGDDAIYPPTLTELQGFVPSSQVLVCPATAHRAGSFTNVEQWTDYIYFGNEREDFLHVALLICPPENHRGKFGHVLWQDGERSRLSSNQVRALVSKPWCMAATDQLNAEATVRVPLRFERIYTNALERNASDRGPR